MPPAADGSKRTGVAWAIATCLGVGHFPFASGTVATAVAVPLYLAARLTLGDAGVLALALAAAAAGTAAAGVMEREMGYHDPSEVVVDEVAGFLVTMLFLPLNVWTCLAGFFLFRALDVAKPWPASRAERLPGGWGIMADDLVCGVIANLVIRAGVLAWR